MKLSVIIVTYNSSHLIEGCLDSIFKNNDIQKSLEVIVVDNSSKDFKELIEIINSKFSDQVKVIQNNSNGGYGQGNNLGVKLSQGEIIMIVNPDVLLFKPIFKDILDRFERDKSLGLLGLQQYLSLGKKGQSFLPIILNIKSYFLLKIYSLLNIFDQSYFCISGACFAINKSTFINAGLFDEKIFLYGEERDLHLRIRKLDERNQIKYNKKLGYIHPLHSERFSISSFETGFKSNLYVIEKNGENLCLYLKGLKNLFLFFSLYSSIRKNLDSKGYYDSVISIINKKIAELCLEK